MAKPEWGVKRVCQSCATKFYDLGRSPITCPQCGVRFDPEALLKSRRSRPAAPAKPGKAETETPTPTKAVVKIVAEDEEELTESVDDEADDAMIEDASELGEDDDMADVALASEDEDD